MPLYTNHSIATYCVCGFECTLLQYYELNSFRSTRSVRISVRSSQEVPMWIVYVGSRVRLCRAACNLLTSPAPAAREEGWVRRSSSAGAHCARAGRALSSCAPSYATLRAGSGTIPVDKR